MADDVFALVSNIPNSFHSQDLRNYFSQFVEGKRFRCFHFRNRPEHRLPKSEGNRMLSKTVTSSGSAQSQSQSHSHTLTQSQSRETLRKATFASQDNQILLPGTAESAATVSTHSPNQQNLHKRKCCIIKMSPQNLKKSLQLYHKKHWVDRSGNAMGLRCFIVGIKITNQGVDSFSRDDLIKLPELNPPEIMPQGNVGTPTQSFLQLIRDCRIPPSVIKKLGLTFPKRRSNRMYGNVPLHYGGAVVPSSSEGTEEVAKTGTGCEIADGPTVEGAPAVSLLGEKLATPHEQGGDSSKEERKTDSESDEDDDTCEEWERHESLHEDVPNQGRTKERLFEQEMEIVWDKGSSGLVFYTDAAYWDAMKGDFDERNCDEWDVDMSIFYEKDGGDKDSRDWLQIQREQRRGVDDTSVFTKNGIGQFERHTKGFGRQLMSGLGWTDGEGLGSGKRGMSEALENEGQTSRDKSGFGYHGEKLCRYPVKKKRPEGAIISTVYDDPAEIDPPASLLRSVEPTHLKHRSGPS